MQDRSANSWDVYAKELASLKYGHALWEPTPLGPEGQIHVHVGDVGFIREGTFHRLFNVFLPSMHPSHQELGVPEGFRPMRATEPRGDTGNPLVPGSYHSKSVKTLEADLHLSVAAGGLAAAAPTGSVSYHCSSSRGAALVLLDIARRTNTDRLGLFEQYIRAQWRTWMAFANTKHGYGIELSEMFVVTGFDKTSVWAMATFAEAYQTVSASVGGEVPGVVTARFDVSGGWHTSAVTHHRWGPLDPHTITYDTGVPSPEQLMKKLRQNGSIPREQCVFLRGFRMKDRFVMGPKVIKAAAGSPDLGSGDNGSFGGSAVQADSTGSNDKGPAGETQDAECTGDVEVESVPDIGRDVNTLEPILDYILNNSDVDLAIAHDTDFYPYLDLPFSDSDVNPLLLDLPAIECIDNVGSIQPKPSKPAFPDLSNLMGDDKASQRVADDLGHRYKKLDLRDAHIMCEKPPPPGLQALFYLEIAADGRPIERTSALSFDAESQKHGRQWTLSISSEFKPIPFRHVCEVSVTMQVRNEVHSIYFARFMDRLSHSMSGNEVSFPKKFRWGYDLKVRFGDTQDIIQDVIRHEVYPNPEDFRRVINCLNTFRVHAINLPHDDLEKAALLDILGGLYLRRWLYSDDDDYLNEAVSMFLAAVNVSPRTENVSGKERALADDDLSIALSDANVQQDPHISTYFAHLGTTLKQRFDVMGSLDDLDRAIRIYEFLASQKSEDQSWQLANLGYLHQLRFGHLEDRTDLDTSIENYEAAIIATTHMPLLESPVLEVLYQRINNWAQLLGHRYERFGDPEDFVRAVDVLTKPLQEMPPRTNEQIITMQESLQWLFALKVQLDAPHHPARAEHPSNLPGLYDKIDASEGNRSISKPKIPVSPIATSSNDEGIPAAADVRDLNNVEDASASDGKRNFQDTGPPETPLSTARKGKGKNRSEDTSRHPRFFTGV